MRFCSLRLQRRRCASTDLPTRAVFCGGNSGIVPKRRFIFFSPCTVRSCSSVVQREFSLEPGWEGEREREREGERGENVGLRAKSRLKLILAPKGEEIISEGGLEKNKGDVKRRKQDKIKEGTEESPNKEKEKTEELTSAGLKLSTPSVKLCFIIPLFCLIDCTWTKCEQEKNTLSTLSLMCIYGAASVSHQSCCSTGAETYAFSLGTITVLVFSQCCFFSFSIDGACLYNVYSKEYCVFTCGSLFRRCWPIKLGKRHIPLTWQT